MSNQSHRSFLEVGNASPCCHMVMHLQLYDHSEPLRMPTRLGYVELPSASKIRASNSPGMRYWAGI